MIKYILFVFSFVLLGQCCNAQGNAKRLLGEFDFNKGNYLLLGHIGVENSDPILGSFGDFYIDDIKTLNSIKEKWKFSKIKANTMDCQQIYFLDICKNGHSEKELSIYNDCSKIVSSSEDSNKTDFYSQNYQIFEYNFNESELTAFNNSFKKAFKKENEFASLELARMFLDSILKDSNLIMVFEPLWNKFDGTFVITYTHNLKLKDYEQRTNIALTNLSKEIKRNYPDEFFYLEAQGTGDKDMIVEIICNKTLADKFILYPIECCKWEKFEPILTSYWKIKK